jgi:division/cell wall cluster transcriptional repressor MraZ
MLQGRWPNVLCLDPKNRLALPARLCEGEEAVPEYSIGKLSDPCLYLHTPKQHRQFLARLYRHLGETSQSRRLKTYVVSRFMPVVLDGQRRITIPAPLIKAAALERELVLVAQKARIEIWPLQAFETMQAEAAKDELESALEKVYADEESELASLRRTARPDGEGNPLARSR